MLSEACVRQANAKRVEGSLSQGLSDGDAGRFGHRDWVAQRFRFREFGPFKKTALAAEERI
jgi:hypothetical protein